MTSPVERVPSEEELIASALRDHRLAGATGDPWYKRPGGIRMPKTYQQTYACKCKAWEGTHGGHVEHVAAAVLAALDASAVTE